MSYSLMIVDQHTIVRQGLISLFENNSDYVVIAYASNGASCLETIKKMKPDIIISDMYLPDMDGVELLSKIKNVNSEIKVIFLTEKEKVSDLIEVYDSNVEGYLHKNVSFSELKRAIVTVMMGEQYIETDILPILNKNLLERDTHQELLDKLTKREKQMLICVASGLSNKEIAVECKISERTVKNHLSSVFQKIEVADRTQAAVFAIKTDLIQI